MSVSLIGEQQLAEKLFDYFESKEWIMVIDSGFCIGLMDDMIEIEEKFFSAKEGKNDGFRLVTRPPNNIFLLYKSMIPIKEFIKYTHGLISVDEAGEKDVILPRPPNIDYPEGFMTEFETEFAYMLQSVAEARGVKKTGIGT